MNDSRAGITDVFVLPDPRRQRILVRVESNAAGPVRLRIADTDTDAMVQPGESTIPFESFVPWLPDAPHLYELQCEAAGGDPGSSPVSVHFGMRECSLQDNRFTMNQRPVHLKGVALEHGDIERLGNAERLAPYFQALREAGINWLTVPASTHHIGTILHWTDTFGMLVTVRFDAKNDVAARSACVRALRNHPSIFAWEWARATAPPDTDRLDPTRFFWCAASPHMLGDTHAWLLRPRGNAPEPFDPIDTHVIAPLSREATTFLRTVGTGDGVSVVSVDGLTAPARPLTAPLDSKSVEAVHADGIRTAIDSLRSNPRLAGYRFESALAPTGGDLPDPVRLAAAREAQTPMRIGIAAARATLTPRQEMDVEIRFLNEHREEGRADLSLQVVGPTNQVLWKKKRNVKLPRHGRELWSGTIAASGSTGTHTFVARLMGDTGRLAESRVPFHVVAPVKPRMSPVDIVDPSGKWLDTIRPLTPNVEVQAPLILIPPLETSVRAYPDNLLGQALGRVREGAVGIVFSPPEDWDDLTGASELDSAAEPIDLLDSAGMCGATVRHPVFDSLPAGVLGDTYRSILPSRAFGGVSEDAIAPVVVWNGDISEGHLVRVRRFGNGRLMFTTLRLLDRLDREPLAARVFLNLLEYGERRALSVPEVLPVERRVVEWIRDQRKALRPWWVIGPFGGNGARDHDKTFPPEEGFEPDATYAGWFRALTWRAAFLPREGEGHLLFARAVPPETIRAHPLGGTFYALTEIHAEARREATLTMSARGRIKAWLNGTPLALGDPDGGPTAPTTNTTAAIPLRDGRNQILVKLTAVGRDAALRVSLV